MKKHILKIAFVAMIGLVAGYGVYNAQKSEKNLSDLMMENVEALANGESGSGEYKCYSILSGSGQAISCSTCQMDTGTPPWYHFGDKCKR